MSAEKHILVVEDNSFLSRAAEARLRRSGFEVTLSRDGEDALRKMQLESFDLVLLDLVLPRVDGFEVLGQLRQKPASARLPVIAMSNLDQCADVTRALTLGAVDYLVKSVTSLDELVAKVNAALDGSSSSLSRLPAPPSAKPGPTSPQA